MIRSAAKVAGVLLAGLLAVFAGAGPAWAHGGPIELEVQGDGGQGVTATVTYAKDHHFVTEQVDLSYTAVTADGKTVGPIPMVASSEGQSFYLSKTPLPVGKWTVTVTATHPSPATKTVAVTAADLPAAPRPTPAAPDGNSTTAVLVVTAAVILAVALATAFALYRRRRTSPA
ncbi:MAG: hypothetical protein GEV28_32745 [Actinophytocola sp.]|uniref:hypothetical protein n=1 Tax=Actinophytocola sp. TaxID=1872138 RepID=UPI00132938DE|nr:hypothetical protein [Actinophytocola sp.]MPZ84897.1 hypothetical protein [Actinophytocola sp.]